MCSNCIISIQGRIKRLLMPKCRLPRFKTFHEAALAANVQAHDLTVIKGFDRNLSRLNESRDSQRAEFSGRRPILHALLVLLWNGQRPRFDHNVHNVKNEAMALETHEEVAIMLKFSRSGLVGAWVTDLLDNCWTLPWISSRKKVDMSRKWDRLSHGLCRHAHTICPVCFPSTPVGLYFFKKSQAAFTLKIPCIKSHSYCKPVSHPGLTGQLPARGKAEWMSSFGTHCRKGHAIIGHPFEISEWIYIFSYHLARFFLCLFLKAMLNASIAFTKWIVKWILYPTPNWQFYSVKTPWGFGLSQHGWRQDNLVSLFLKKIEWKAVSWKYAHAAQTPPCYYLGLYVS